jgi:hypothetical protein
MRRPAALAVTTAVLAIMVPTGAAVADEGEVATDPTVVESPAQVEVAAVEAPAAETASAETEPAVSVPTEGASSDPVAVPAEPAPDAAVATDEPQAVSASAASEPVAVANQPVLAQGLADPGDGQASPDEDPGYEADGLTLHGVVGDPFDGGYAEVGRTLSVTPSPDFAPGEQIVVTWFIDGLPGPTGPSFTPGAEHVGATIEVELDGGPQWHAYAYVADTVKAAAVPDDPTSPDNPTSPEDEGVVYRDVRFHGVSAFNGEAKVGTPITVEPVGDWPSTTEFVFTWYTPHSGWQTSSSYTPVAADVGSYVEARYERWDEGFLVDWSNMIIAGSVVDPNAVPDLPVMEDASLQVTGFERVNPTLGTPLTVQADGVPQGAAFEYTWTVDGQVRGTAATFTPTAADLGKFLSVDVVVRHEGYQDHTFHQSFDVVVTTPTVTVGAKSVLVGQEATVKVSVAGPQGAVVPAGTAKISLTSRATGEVRTFHGVELDHGVATFAAPGLAVGLWDITAWYQPQQVWSYTSLVTAAISFQSEYVEAEGHGTLDVRRATAVLTAPTQLSVPVATRAVVQAQVTAKGATIGTSWTIREGASVLASGKVGADGKINAALPVLSIGSHALVLEVAQGKQTTAVSGALTVVVDGEPVQVGGTPTAELDTPQSATAPGQEMELVAEGFQPGETVAFYLHSDPVFLGTAVADANGVARLMAWVPADVPAGAHTVVATGGTTGRWADLAVTLAVPAEATPVAAPVAVAVPAADPASVPAAGDLAVTGSQSGVLMTGAWLMLLVGGGLVVLARKVRTLR